MFSGELCKARARTALKENFWRCVLVGLILVLFCNNTYTASKNTAQTQTGEQSSELATGLSIDNFIDTNAILSGEGKQMTPVEAIQKIMGTTGHGIFNYMVRLGSVTIPMAGIMTVVTLILEIFVFNMLKVGGARFFIANADSPDAEATLIISPFRDRNYNGMVATMLLKDLQILLYTLLLVIPGIIKAYELRLVPYLLADDPEMDYKEAFARSREMMMNNKWNAFLLDLSFIGWKLLKLITYNLSGAFWSDPYEYAANAEMYIQLCETEGTEDDAVNEEFYDEASEEQAPETSEENN